MQLFCMQHGHLKYVSGFEKKNLLLSQEFSCKGLVAKTSFYTQEFDCQYSCYSRGDMVPAGDTSDHLQVSCSE